MSKKRQMGKSLLTLVMALALAAGMVVPALAGVGTVATTGADNVGVESASMFGTWSGFFGNDNVKRVGAVYSKTSEIPTPECGMIGCTVLSLETTADQGYITEFADKLTPNTQYSFRVFVQYDSSSAQNLIIYGNVMTFTTTRPLPDVVFTPNGSTTPAQSQTVVVTVNRGTRSAYAWSTDKNTHPDDDSFKDFPYWSGGTITKSSGDGTYYLWVRVLGMFQYDYYTSAAFVMDNTRPTVTISRAVGQTSPADTVPVDFAVTFSEPVTGFDAGDVTLSGTAGGTTATVTGDGAIYNVAVSGMTKGGSVIMNIDAGKASDSAGNQNTAATVSGPNGNTLWIVLPEAANKAVETLEDIPVEISLYDLNAGVNKYVILSFPTHGTLSDIDPKYPNLVTYTPADNYAGEDSFAFIVNNGKADSAPATVSITVVQKTITSIAITTPPSKTSYVAGQSFDPAGMVVTATYDNGSIAPVTGYTYAPSGALATTNKKVTVSFEGMKAEQAITVVAKAVTSITITTPPSKTSYIVGQSFSKTGMVVTATYNDGSSVPVTSYTYAPTGSLAVTHTKVTVSFSGKTADQAITVLPKAITGIVITTPPSRTSYIAGQSFSKTGMVVTATYNDGSTAAVTGYTYAPTGALAVTDTKITVSYDGQTAEQAITVAAKAVTGIAITTPPADITYIEGQSFNPAGMVVTATYNDGSKAEATGCTYAPDGALATADKKIIISYEGKTAEQAITVVAKAVDNIAITKVPDDDSYVEGQSFNPAGMVVTATYNDGSKAEATGYTYAPDGALATADKKITISYEGKTAEQAITVVPKAITGIAVTTPPTYTSYVQGQSFDPAGMVVTATYNDGSTAAVTGYTYAPDGLLATTDAKVIVSYGGKTAEQAITVNPFVPPITPPATSQGDNTGVLGETVKDFDDVHKGDWFYNAVQYVVTKNLFSGTSATTFEPETAMTRGMLVTVLYRLEGSPAADTANLFSDVPAGQYYTNAVIWASGKGIVHGYDGKFSPDAAVTREQMAVILYNYAAFKGYSTSTGTLDKYTDASRISDYALQAMKWAVGNDLLKGKSTAAISPQDTASRAEVAELLMRFVEKFV